MVMTKLHLLGPPQLTVDGQLLRLRSRKALAVLAYLALARESVPRVTLVDLIWPDQSEKRGRANLSWALNLVRNACGPVVAGDAQFAWCDTTVVATDCAALLALTPESTLGERLDALQLWRGELLAGFFLAGCAEFDSWLLGARERWQRRLIRLAEGLLLDLEEAGDHKQALRVAELWVRRLPWQEGAHRAAIRNLLALGRREAARAQLAQCERLLDEELGVSPSAETRALLDARPERSPPLRPIAPLPRAYTRFVGRDETLVHLLDTLRQPECALVTLVGPGGVGKSRLAVEAARRLADEFDGEIWFFPLATLPAGSDETELATQMAARLQVKLTGQATAVDELLNFLGNQRALLILDNFEQLNALCPFLVTLVDAAPYIKLLITSRVRCDLQLEWVVEIGGLPYPHGEGEVDYEGLVAENGALTLLDNALQRQGTILAPADKDKAIAIARLAEGMPLALELAAAQLRHQTADAVAAALRGNLDALATMQSDLPDRHRSLRAVYEHSRLLLDAAGQVLLGQLTVFEGPFTGEAALAVTAARPAALRTLVRHSLITRREDSRFTIHSLLRQFAAQSAGGQPALARARDRHADYYAHFAGQRVTALRGRRVREVLDEFE